jgi:SAM-dependent methyltransferase
MIIFWIVFGFVMLFGFVVLFGAPYVPTLDRQTDAALDLLDLKPGQILLELGCGDGRVAKRAAVRGLRVIGYELNPILVVLARINTFRYRERVRIIWQNFWLVSWPATDGIYVFLLDKYMKKLDKKIIQEYAHKQIKLASYTFRVPHKEPARVSEGVYLYNYDSLKKNS